VPVAEPRQAAEQTVLPEPTAGELLFRYIEAEKGRDPPPLSERAVPPQVLVAGLEAIGAAIAPARHVAQRGGARVLHLEDVLCESGRQFLQRPLIGEVVVARRRLVQPALARGLVVVHGGDHDVARIANEMEDPHVLAIKQGSMITEI
jgi:hypothetical protein